jgi:hypothetical protein
MKTMLIYAFVASIYDFSAGHVLYLPHQLKDPLLCFHDLSPVYVSDPKKLKFSL